MKKFLAGLIKIVTPNEKQDWAAAMIAEIYTIPDRREAIWFAASCLWAAIQLRIAIDTNSHARERLHEQVSRGKLAIPFVSGIGAIAIGLVYLVVMRAPTFMIAVNATAALLGLVILFGLSTTFKLTPRFASIVTVGISITLVFTALFGSSIEGASRWVKTGPLFIQTSILLLPLAVTLFSRVSNFWTLTAMILSAIAVALQPDRGMAGALFAALLTLVVLRRTPSTMIAMSVSAAGFCVAMLQPDRLPAVPYVDHILWTSFDVNSVLGLTMWVGAGLLFLPIALSRFTRSHHDSLVFASCWGGIVIAAASGAYPTPLVGYGGGAIVGYFLCLTALRKIQKNDRTLPKPMTERPPKSHNHSSKFVFG